MANWTRRQLAITALRAVSSALVLLNSSPLRVWAQSCSPNYYDTYECPGCDSQMFSSGLCGCGGGGNDYTCQSADCCNEYGC